MAQKAEKDRDVSVKFTYILIAAGLILAVISGPIQSPLLTAIGLVIAVYCLIMLVAAHVLWLVTRRN